MCGEVKTHLLGLMELPCGDSDAATISKCILDTIEDYGIELQCVAAFGSDGASAMTGKAMKCKAETAAAIPCVYSLCSPPETTTFYLLLLKLQIQFLPLNSLRVILISWFAYFHQSPKRGGHLEATFTQLFNQPVLKLKKPSDT